MIKFWTIAVSGLCLCTLVHGQAGGEVLTTTDGSDLNGIDIVDFSREVLNAPINTEWKVSLSLVNFFPVVGFSIWFYFNSPGLPGIIVTGFDGMPAFINPVPGQSTLFQDNFIEGGTLNTIADPQGPIIVPANCLFPADIDPTNITEPPDCSMVDPFPVIEIFLTTIEPATPSQIIIGGPPSISLEQPIFAVTTIVMPSALLPFATPVPAPTPVPVPVTVKSDPHLKGIKGQEFDVEGIPGTIYNFITDRNPADRKIFSLILNANFSQAYTTGIWMSSSGVLSYRPKGTWVSDIGLMIGDVAMTVSVAVYNSRAEKRSEDSLKFGSISVLGSPYDRLGRIHPTDDISVTLSNSRSFSRIVIDSPLLCLQVDVVSPPNQWQVEEQDLSRLSHINLSILSTALFDAEGLIGETMYHRYDREGRPILKSSGPDGEGLLKFPVSSYAVPHIFCPMLNI